MILKKPILIFILIFLIIFTGELISAEVKTLGTYKINECIDLPQSGADFLFCNVTSVEYPNSTLALSESVMTKNGTQYNKTFCSTDATGKYIVNGFCTNVSDDVVWAYDFTITKTGIELTQERALVYLGMLALLIFMFFVNIGGIAMLPSSNTKDDEGVLLGISKLKYLRTVLFVVGWALLLAIVFTASNISYVYLETKMMGDLLFTIYQMMMWLSIPMIIIWTLFLLSNIFEDKEIKNLLERGIKVEGSP